MRIVVSLTSTPTRVDKLYKTLDSILAQKRVPDAVYINLPRRFGKENKPFPVPQALKDFVAKRPRIHINRPPKDLGPGTKIHPTLAKEKGPHTRIVTIDDDVLYDRRLLKVLEDRSKAMPDRALCFAGWNVSPTGDLWDLGDHCRESTVDIIEGWAGALYVRKFFMAKGKTRGSFADRAAAFLGTMTRADKRCYFTDDIWISAWLARRSIPIFMLRRNKYAPRWKPAHSHSNSEGALSESGAWYDRNHGCAKHFLKDWPSYKAHMAGKPTHPCYGVVKRNFSEPWTTRGRTKAEWEAKKRRA